MIGGKVMNFIEELYYCDTWMEFPAMYRHVEKVKKIVEDKVISPATSPFEPKSISAKMYFIYSYQSF